ncbi:MAG: thioredoxin domain-containing protein [Candidatus Paceibacterota bacterium]
MQEKNTNKKESSFERIIIGSAVVLGIAIISIALIFGKNSSPQPIDGSGDPVTDGRTGLEIRSEEVLGNPDASSTIVGFLDFQCSACAIFFAQIEPQIRAQYIDTGKAKMIVKTLSFIDGYSKRGESFAAARAAQCAREQKGFWNMHDAILSVESSEIIAKKNNENNNNLTRDTFIGFAEQGGLNIPAFTTCYDSDSYASITDEYLKDAQVLLGNNISTPTIFINGTRLENAFDLKEYEALIQ